MSSVILSTKSLSLPQKSLLLNSGIGFVEYDAISIEHQDFRLPKIDFDYLIFTSQNAVKAYLKHRNKLNANDRKNHVKEVFCVGEKTRSLLEENSLKVMEVGKNALELSKKIAKSYKNCSFLWITGDKALPTLPQELTKNNIRYNQVFGYHTLLNPREFNREFDGVLFFSPSGVESYFQVNTTEVVAFCIGETTAEAAKRFTKNIIVANKPTVENTIVQAVKHLNQTIQSS